MKEYTLPYGSGCQKVMLPEEHILYDIHGNKASVAGDIKEATLNALRSPVESAPLKDIVQKGDKVAVIVSDITRLVRTADFLPVVIDEINAGGVPDEDITIVVATGTHRAHTPEEDVLVCGQEIVNRIKIHQHDCRNNAELVDLGVTSRGTPILIDKTVAEADKIIITGAVSLHPMAGFGGGRKAVMPGVSGHATIMHNHAMALADEVGAGCNPLCETGVLENNPLHEDMTEVCAKINPAFLVNMVFSPEGDLHEVVAGHWYKAWEKGCRFDSWSELFLFDKWMEAFEETGVDPAFYANRKRSFDEILPWDHISIGVTKQFLINERKKAEMAITTPNCREQCSNCGAAAFGGGVCFESREKNKI